MATLAQLGSQRKKSLRVLLQLSRRLNTAQEALDREIKRIVNRKQAIPEAKDIDRLIDLAMTVEVKVSDLSEGAVQISRDWLNA